MGLRSARRNPSSLSEPRAWTPSSISSSSEIPSYLRNQPLFIEIEFLLWHERNPASIAPACPNWGHEFPIHSLHFVLFTIMPFQWTDWRGLIGIVGLEKWRVVMELWDDGPFVNSCWEGECFCQWRVDLTVYWVWISCWMDRNRPDIDQCYVCDWANRNRWL